MDDVIQVHRVRKYFRSAAGEFQAIKDVSLNVAAGEYVGIVGHSGSGKSTLLNLIGGIDSPDRGSVCIAGDDLGAMSESALAKYRGRHIGIVFQFFQLIPTLNLIENVVLAMDLVGKWPRGQRRGRAMDLLKQMGVEEHGKKLPSQISGGEQQRVAIARALANDPEILIADEPTGNLDSHNSSTIRRLFADCAAQGRTVLVATHETEAMSEFSRIVALEDGAMVEVDRD